MATAQGLSWMASGPWGQVIDLLVRHIEDATRTERAKPDCAAVIAVHARAQAVGPANFQVVCDVIPDPGPAERALPVVLIVLHGEPWPSIANRLAVLRERIERATPPAPDAAWVTLR